MKPSISHYNIVRDSVHDLNGYKNHVYQSIKHRKAMFYSFVRVKAVYRKAYKEAMHYSLEKRRKHIQ